MANPLRCEVGDQTKKVGTYDIGGDKAFYTDVNLNLEGKISGKCLSIVVDGTQVDLGGIKVCVCDY